MAAESGEVKIEDLPALFWDTLPDNAEGNSDYAAVQALMDDDTPEERAENCKIRGNEKLKVARKVKNKVYHHEAVTWYTKGLDVKCSDDKLNSILYGNRAQVHIMLGNWRKALNDSQAALELDSENLKACYRGARAAFKLHEMDVALELCESGLFIEPDNKELLLIEEEAEKRKAKMKVQQDQERSKRQKLQEQAKALANQMSTRDVRVCQPNFKVGKFRPWVDDDDVLHWPALFVYPETMQQDVIEDVAETDTLGDHLDVMFGPDAPPLVWDEQKEYSRDTIEVYYLGNAGKPFSWVELVTGLVGQFSGDVEDHAPQMYGENAAFWVKVDQSKMVQDILREENHIVPGVPTFFIVAKGSNYHDRFLSSVLNGG